MELKKLLHSRRATGWVLILVLFAITLATSILLVACYEVMLLRDFVNREKRFYQQLADNNERQSELLVFIPDSLNYPYIRGVNLRKVVGSDDDFYCAEAWRKSPLINLIDPLQIIKKYDLNIQGRAFGFLNTKYATDPDFLLVLGEDFFLYRITIATGQLYKYQHVKLLNIPVAMPANNSMGFTLFALDQGGHVVILGEHDSVQLAELKDLVFVKMQAYFGYLELHQSEFSSPVYFDLITKKVLLSLQQQDTCVAVGRLRWTRDF